MFIFNYFQIALTLESSSEHNNISQKRNNQSINGQNSTFHGRNLILLSSTNFEVEDFYYKASLVQFDLPDFCFVSAYVLLLIVWAEAILQSRRHWLSSSSFKRMWILGYMIFNILLYSTQASLYSLLFVPQINQRILGDFIYLTLTTISFGVPLLWICCYLYLSFAV